MSNKAYNLDCMEAMTNFPDKHFELAIVDPPYGINFAKANTGNGWVVRESKSWDKQIPKAEYFKELFRISINQIIWGGNYMVEFLPPSQSWIFWDKGQRDFSLADGELAFTSFDKAMRVVSISRASFIKERAAVSHPTAKPIALYKWLLKNYAKPGDKILDTHLGSGSSRIACYDMGFDFTGYELDKEYFDKSVERFNNHIAQQTMFTDENTTEVLEQKELF